LAARKQLYGDIFACSFQVFNSGENALPPNRDPGEVLILDHMVKYEIPDIFFIGYIFYDDFSCCHLKREAYIFDFFKGFGFEFT